MRGSERRMAGTVSGLFGEERRVAHVPMAFSELVAARVTTARSRSPGGGTARSCYELLAVAARRLVRSRGVLRGRAVGAGARSRLQRRHGPSDVPRRGRARRHPLALRRRARPPPRRRAPTTSGSAAPRRSGSCTSGLGPDGHTASLFPGLPPSTRPSGSCVDTGDDLHPHPRLTLTYPALAQARLVVFTVAGADKREALARVRRGDDVPAGRVRAERVVWLVDEAAAGGA